MRFEREILSAVLSLGLLLAATGCNQVPFDPPIDIPEGGGSTDPGTDPGPGPTNPQPTATPSPTPVPTSTPIPTPTPVPTPTPIPTSAANCVSSDPNRQCMALNLVAYRDSAGTATLSRAGADAVVQKMNQIWSPCNIAFQLEQYEAADPTVSGLSYGNQSQYELNPIRNEFGNNSTFLVVVTGPWSGGTIAWTTMPGGGPFGTIVEKDYGSNAMTVGHEIGHYMGLYHVGDSSNLMNAYIGSNTSGLTTSQCNTARQTNSQHWQRMMRR